MNTKLKIYKLNNGLYGFSINGFSSHKHYPLSSSVKSMYRFAWDAYKDAKLFVEQKSYHLLVAEKTGDIGEYYYDNVVSDVSSDKMLSSHYLEIYEGVEGRAKSVKKEDSDDGKVLYQEIKNIVQEIMTIKSKIESKEDKKKMDELIGKFSSLTKKYFANSLQKDYNKSKEEKEESEESKKQQEETAQEESIGEIPKPDVSRSMAGNPGMPPGAGQPQMPKPVLAYVSNKINKFSNKIEFSDLEKKEIVEHYCDLICNALKKSDGDIIGKIDGDNICLIKNNKPQILVSVNSMFMVDNIVPMGEMSVIYPHFTVEFYQKYWKPIVESVSHFYMVKNGKKYIITETKLPDVYSNNDIEELIKVFDLDEQSVRHAKIRFYKDINKQSIWSIDGIVKKSQYMQSAEQQLPLNNEIVVGSMVSCVDPSLKSLNGHNGEVKNIFDKSGIAYVDVDFGHHAVRLEKNKCKKINI